MARTVRDAKLETRAARDRLTGGQTIHWRTVVPGMLHVGYRRTRPGLPGTWIARRYLGEENAGHYQKKSLGLADDFQDADGRAVLSFAQAQQAAQSFAAVGKNASAKTDPTVRQVVEAYIKHLRAEKKSGADAERRAEAMILPALGGLRVSALTTPRLEKWRDDMAASPARVRTSRRSDEATKQRPGQRFKSPPASDDERRARRATVNRTVSILKAALNRAFRSGVVDDDLAWRRLKPFGRVEAARPGHLSVTEATRLVNAADDNSGFRDMVRAALLTGCRYSELGRLVVGDYRAGRLTISESKSGRPRTVRLTEEADAFFAALVAGRTSGEHILRRRDAAGEVGAWGYNHQLRPMRSACGVAAIVPAVGFHQLRHTWASLAVMGGMPLMLVAETLGHADTRMVERHYGHLTEDYRDEMIRKYSPRFGFASATNVVSIDSARGPGR